MTMKMNMTTTPRILCALLACAFGAASAADLPNPPSWYHHTWSIPILRGEYMPINGGTLGTLSVGYTDDANRTFGGATMFYDAEGNPVTQAVAGQVHFNDDAVVSQTGVIAWTDVSFYALSDGPCRGCADHPRSQQQTADTGRFEWTGPRGGRLTVNGQTQDMVEAFSGPPLVAGLDLSGTWLLMVRYDSLYYVVTPPRPSHTEQVAFVQITAAPSRSYEAMPYDGPYESYGPVPLPPPGSREFDVTCASGIDASCADLAWVFGAEQYSPQRFTIWLDDTNAGRLLPVRLDHDPPRVSETSYETARVYATQDRVLIRRRTSPAYNGHSISERLLVRIGDEVGGSVYWPTSPLFR